MTWTRAVPAALLALLLLSPTAAEPGEAGTGTGTATPTPTSTSTTTSVETPPLPSGERAGVRGTAPPPTEPVPAPK